MVIIEHIKEQGMNGMKIFRRISAALLAAVMLVSLAACNGNTPGNDSTSATESTTSYIRETKTRIATLSGPLGIGISKLGADRDYAYDVKYHADAQQVVSLLKNGETDIAVLPVNLAANVYNETDGAVRIIAVNTLGVFHILENGKEIKSINDLKGKTVYAFGEGSLPEYLLSSVLESSGLKGSVKVEYKEDYSEIEELMSEGKADVCMLPEPYAAAVASSAEGVRYALDLSDEWANANETPFVQSVVVARAEYIESNAEYIETFLMHNEISVNFLSELPEAGAAVLAQTGSFKTAEEAQAALAGCNPRFIRGEEMKTALNAVFDMLYQADSALIGGKMPDDGIYYAG